MHLRVYLPTATRVLYGYTKTTMRGKINIAGALNINAWPFVYYSQAQLAVSAGRFIITDILLG